MPVPTTKESSSATSSQITRDHSLTSIGAVSYLNSKPLVEGLDEIIRGRATLRLDYPSRLAEDLSSGDLDVALIPSIEYFRGDGYEVISDACVAAHGPVLSVKLYSRVPWGEITSLALDEGSRTSATLARILLGEQHGVYPRLEPLPMDLKAESSTTDAVLVIGDRAMFPPNESFVETWDLGEEWYNWTGLPFVFAMWVGHSKRLEQKWNRITSNSVRSPISSSSNGLNGMCHSGSPLNETAIKTKNLSELLSRARDLGCRDIDVIAQREAPRLNLPRSTVVRYLSENLQYHLGPAERSGLKLFYELAKGMDLAPSGMELKFR
ncbi:MAG: menaquinone biosynthesis protein [Planctomycetes bacterium]|nr:menaquinone biosynthesis protein [Planctomycetota bacterium]